MSVSLSANSEVSFIHICTINEANMGIQVAAIAERYKRQMMAQMQAAQSGGNSADGSVQVGINLPENDGRTESCRR